MPEFQGSRREKQASDHHSLCFPLNLSLNLINSSVSKYLLWTFLTLCSTPRRSQRNTLLSTSCGLTKPYTFLAYIHPFLSVRPQYLENTSTLNPQWSHLAGTLKHSLPGNAQLPCTLKIQRGQQKPRNGKKITLQKQDQISTPRSPKPRCLDISIKSQSLETWAIQPH